MRILASSLIDTAHGFLHAGYISAYPRTMDPSFLPSDAPKLQVDLAEALRLQGESLGAATTSGGSASAASLLGQLPGWSSLLAAALAIVAAVLLYQLLDDRTRARAWRVLSALTGAALLAVLGACSSCRGGLAALPTKAPWEGVALRQYASPEQATRVLLHGIIADGIANVGQPIDMLANIQHEVGIPSRTLTDGQAYALRTYGIDGWGKPFRLTKGDGYRVTSAGPDGAFDTADDLSARVAPCTDANWESGRRAFVIRKAGKGYEVLFHRWTGEFFKYHDQAGAAAATGGQLFDRWAWEKLPEEKQKLVAAAYQKVAAGHGREPLVLQVF
jgi:hypothetical protein